MATKLAMVQDDYDEAVRQKGDLDDAGQEAPLPAGPLAGFIYHDLRLPLTAILAYSELMAGDHLDGLQRQDFHKEIRLAVHRMNDLISLLLESSKGPENLRSEVADIQDAVERAIQVVAIRPEFSRIAICYEHEGLGEGRFDSGRLQQVITNIILNACEAVSAVSGRVEVKSCGRSNHIEISIKDNGPGIPQPIHHGIFQPFVSYGKSGGTGLGLAIVQKILRDRGGEIFLDSKDQNGTLFRVVFPYAGPHCKDSRVTPAFVLEVCDQRI